MTEEEWPACGDPQQMLTLLCGRASARKLRLFVAVCCAEVLRPRDDVRCLRAAEVSVGLAAGPRARMKRWPCP
jgi:hypothetical protein